MNDNKEILGKLEQLDKLIAENKRLDYYIEHGAAREALEQIAVIREKRGQAPKAPAVYTTMPVYPKDKSIYLPAEKTYNTYKKILLGLAGLAVVSVVLLKITNVDFFSTLGAFGFIGAIIMLFKRSTVKNNYIEKKKEYDNSVENYNKTLNAFRSGLAKLDQEKQTALDQLNAYKQLNATCYEEYTVAFNQYSDNIDSAKALYSVNSDEINSIDVLHPSYHHLVTNIIANLKSGRADDLKEALNLAIDEERQEQEAAARREAEARRQAEEERRTEIMRRQAEEERRHNEQMERQQAEQAREAARQQQAAARQQQEAARQQAWDAKVAADKARSEQRAAENRSRGIGVSKCATCANSSRCPSHVKNSGAGLTCGGYRPREIQKPQDLILGFVFL